MLFRGIKEDNGWMVVDYSATWKYGYEFILDACQVIIDTDFQEKLQRVAITYGPGTEPVECLESVKKCEFDVRKCNITNKESSALMVAGISKIMECPVKKIFEEHGDHVFDNYMNSVEIKAYCRDAVRQGKDYKG